jgi:hypothetical protein
VRNKNIVDIKLSGIVMLTLILASLGLMLTAYASINVSTGINSSGSISSSLAISPELRLYSDSACNLPLTSIEWGSLSPGGTVSRIVYIKNTQGATSLTLSMTAKNWNPTTANGPLTLSWNKQGTTLPPGQVTAATISLSASSSIAGISSFGVQILINGTN